MKRRDKLEFGICKICGEHKILTDEHIPPRSAFNNGTMMVYSSEEAIKTITDKDRLPWDFDGLKYKLKQGGRTFKTLCGKCNSYCGTNYVDYYQTMVKSFAYFLSTLDISKAEIVDAKTDKFRPLPFFKQIISMFSSITDISKNDDIKEFILDKDNNNFNDKKYRVYINIFRNGINRMFGKSVLVRRDGNFLVSEIVSYPFIFVLLEGADEHILKNFCEFGFDITYFTKFKYDEEIKLEISLPIKECNINMPCDYRTKQEIIKCRDENLQKNKPK